MERLDVAAEKKKHLVESVAERFVRGEVPLSDFWRALDASVTEGRSVGAAAVDLEDIHRAIAWKLEGTITLSSLCGWAGTVASFSCFVIKSRQVKAALTRLAMTELSDEGLKALAAKLREGGQNTQQLRRVV